MSETSYKVQKLIVKDFKNIEDLEIDFNGKSVFLIGDNAQGKSSVIQAIWLALSRMKAPSQPIMEGKEEARIMVIIGTDSKQYKVERTFKEDGSESLEITSPDGFKTSKIANLQALVGDINFDIMKFVALCDTVPGRREQVKMVRGFMPPEVNAEVDQLDAKKKQIDEERTEINKDITKLKAKIIADKFSEDELIKYKEPIVVATLMTELKEANEFNKKLSEAKKRKTDAEAEVKAIGAKIVAVSDSAVEALKKLKEDFDKAMEKIKTDSDAEIDKLTNAGLEQEKIVVDTTEELKDVVEKPVTAIEEKIKNSEEHNTKHNEIKEQAAFVAELAEKKAQYDSRKVQLDEIAEKRQVLISSAKLPVEGLGFTDDHLTFNGIPLEEEAQSTSELMEIGMKLAVAKSPVTRIVRIDRAESIGTKRMERMKQIGFAADFQMFYEEVQRDVEELKVQFIEQK